MKNKDCEKELKRQLQKEKIKHEISMLKAQTLEVWVKEIRSVLLLFTFSIGTLVNLASYFLGVMGKKSLPSPAPLLEGVGYGGGMARVPEIVEEVSQFDISSIFTSHIFWQILLAMLLIPFIKDIFNKLFKGGKNAGTHTDTIKK